MTRPEILNVGIHGLFICVIFDIEISTKCTDFISLRSLIWGMEAVIIMPSEKIIVTFLIINNVIHRFSQ